MTEQQLSELLKIDDMKERAAKQREFMGLPAKKSNREIADTKYQSADGSYYTVEDLIYSRKSNY